MGKQPLFKSKRNKGTYASRNPENRGWTSIMGYDNAERAKFFAPKENNLPDDAFADDVNADDDVGTYHKRMTEVEGGWSSLGEYEKTNKET
jgi:hypothetical protein